jgi:hypothetical protein
LFFIRFGVLAILTSNTKCVIDDEQFSVENDEWAPEVDKFFVNDDDSDEQEQQLWFSTLFFISLLFILRLLSMLSIVEM